MHDHRVGGRDIQTGFHNRRGQQDVIFPVVKGVHPVVELSGGHLPMGNKIGQLGQLLFQERFDFGQIGDAGHNIEGLPAAIMFAQ